MEKKTSGTSYYDNRPPAGEMELGPNLSLTPAQIHGEWEVPSQSSDGHPPDGSLPSNFSVTFPPTKE